MRLWVPYVCLITILPLSYELWKQSSFGQTTFLLWVPPFLSYELWKLRIELWKLLVQTGSKVLRSDRCGEYESPFGEFCLQHGIVHQTTTPYSP